MKNEIKLSEKQLSILTEAAKMKNIIEQKYKEASQREAEVLSLILDSNGVDESKVKGVKMEGQTLVVDVEEAKQKAK